MTHSRARTSASGSPLSGVAPCPVRLRRRYRSSWHFACLSRPQTIEQVSSAQHRYIRNSLCHKSLRRTKAPTRRRSSDFRYFPVHGSPCRRLAIRRAADRSHRSFARCDRTAAAARRRSRREPTGRQSFFATDCHLAHICAHESPPCSQAEPDYERELRRAGVQDHPAAARHHRSARGDGGPSRRAGDLSPRHRHRRDHVAVDRLPDDEAAGRIRRDPPPRLRGRAVALRERQRRASRPPHRHRDRRRRSNSSPTASSSCRTRSRASSATTSCITGSSSTAASARRD